MRKRSLGQGNMFTGVCLSTGGCLFLQGVPVLGGACSRVGWYLFWRGSCFWGTCFQGEPAPGRWCLVLGGPGGDPPDGYCCGRYVSYWNAFLFYQFLISQYCRKIYFLSDASLQPVGESTLMADTVRNCTKQTMCQNQRGIITIQCHLLQTKTTFLSMVTI